MSNQETLGNQVAADSVDDLEVTRERTKQPIDAFIESWHSLDPVPGWKAAFGARYQDRLVAVIIIGRPVSRVVDDGSELSITRYARRDDRPDNTGSWLIARVKPWVKLEGYDTLSAHAGIAGNYGTVYEAAGAECVKVDKAKGDGWSNRDNRDEWDDYERRKWVWNL